MSKELYQEIKFIFYTVHKNMQSQMELKFSFWFAVFGMALNNVAFVIVWMLFGELAGGMGGWRSVDYLLAFGISTTAFGICYGFFGGLRFLPEIVKHGDLDKYLLSPKSSLFRISTSKFLVPALGDLLFGLISVVAWVFLTQSFSLFVFVNILFFVVISFLLWFFFTVFCYSLVFWFQNPNSIVDGVFELLITPSIFYGGAFTGWLRNFFIFIIPSFLLGNIAIEVIKNPTWQMYIIVCAITLFWIVFALYIFRISVRRYESSNFINFG